MPVHALPQITTGELASLDARTWIATAHGSAILQLVMPPGQVILLDGHDERFVLPSDLQHTTLTGRGTCWVLPPDPDASEGAWQVSANGAIEADVSDAVVHLTVHAPEARLVRHRARPHTDANGDGFALDIPGGDLLADALAGFGWGTMLPSVVERTRAAASPDWRVYVVSTLAETYLGTYPDVDHEFQIKGRLAWGGQLEHDVVRRMIELQLRLMREDPQQLWRDPCAVQPSGEREYHVRRNSMDGTANAVMFLVTGNVEVIESVWLYVARTGDIAWLRAHIEDLEGAASGISLHIDPLGRLWGDVYYEDQVIKDGRETTAQALAVRSFDLLAQLQEQVGRGDQAAASRLLRDRLAANLVQPLPQGYWDPDSERFVDWVDRSGAVHDHIHLLANILPVLVGAASPQQREHVEALVDAELPELQRFPTFLSARVAEYTDDEIGDGGPYDLCAAGRYWCWDAAYWSARGDGAMLLRQLERVAAQGAGDGWVMGERYDMEHVYYVDGSPWHGAAHYYEYPCVYSWVLLHDYLGMRPCLDADLLVSPRVQGHGEVSLHQQAYQLRYRIGAGSFTLTNLAATARSYRFELAGILGEGSLELAIDGAPGAAYRDGTVTLAPGSSAVLTPTSAAEGPQELPGHS
ncbi:hypothetical protein [Pseudactinotalea sp.]|uniref:hypothetical protein n=1 Tax=Pseudactinotalea sp. TaxID=1926260 RepID=UPI003B3A1716